MNNPTTGNTALDTVVSDLVRTIRFASANIDQRGLQQRLLATPVPSDPIGLALYRMLNTLAENLAIIQTRGNEQ